MSFQLPTSDSPLRELFSVAHLVEVASPENRYRLPTLRDAINSARKVVDAGAHSANCICVTADGNLRLVRIGSKGGIKRLWNFGKI